jgi:hypothetical protein
MTPQPLGSAPLDGRWVRLWSTRYGIASKPVRWRPHEKEGPGWYSARGYRICRGKIFDRWLPREPARPAWCNALGLEPRATREEIIAAYRELAKVAHPDVGGSHEAMTALTRARDEALRARP